ncbi:hypothetical protein MNB_SV-12-1647 [hydrothermal vent metagenome]|uniref:Lipoprotein n=1 Tax=hydrothermal vent metagenome TaxID=652676 RepID=A0A1W1CHA2_9ZZZZ
MLKKLFYPLPIAFLFIVGCSGQPGHNGEVEISGQISYDRVPSVLSHGGLAKLDYDNIKRVSSKNIVIKAIGRDGKTVTETTTDKNGKYSLFVEPNIEVKIRAYARMHKEGFWDVSVVDNTNMKALYVLEGKYHNSGTKHNVRNLHAPSGWGGTDYTKARVAAPFAILDSINQVMSKIRKVDSDAKFPQLTVNWSVNNIAAGGDPDAGQIVTSNYDGERGLWILGDANSDTDEYDDHIIIHEWGHYFEDQFSRTDSIGGPHGSGEALDIRLAFGEGWGNALSGIATDDPFYFDTSGYGQSTGWYMDLEGGAQKHAGWFSEGSVQRILYDLYDKTNESHDKTSLGFGPIYKTMIGGERETKAFTSIFSFIDALKSEASSHKRDIDKTVAYEKISRISDSYGSNRNNNGDSAVAVPVYRDLRVGGTVDACSRNNYGVYNKLGNRTYIKVKISSDGSYRFDAQPKSYGNQDPDMILYDTKYPHKDIGISQYEGSPSDTLSVTLKKGEYLLDVYDASYNNSCSRVSLHRESGMAKPNAKGKTVVSKPVKRRNLPRRQYY